MVRGDQVLVAERAEYIDTVTPPLWNVEFSDYEVRGYIVAESLADGPDEVRFLDSDDIPVTIRHVVESDSEEGGNHPFFPNHPLPVEVIGAIMAGTQGPTELYAVVDANGGREHARVEVEHRHVRPVRAGVARSEHTHVDGQERWSRSMIWKWRRTTRPTRQGTSCNVSRCRTLPGRLRRSSPNRTWAR